MADNTALGTVTKQWTTVNTVNLNADVVTITDRAFVPSPGVNDSSERIANTGFVHAALNAPPVATQDAVGLMSAADKAKLDNIAAGANSYVHPANAPVGTYTRVTVNQLGHVTQGASPTTLAGYGITDAQPLNSILTKLSSLAASTNRPNLLVVVKNDLQLETGVLTMLMGKTSAEEARAVLGTPSTAEVTTSTPGLMSAADKTKLNQLSTLVGSDGSIITASAGTAGLMSTTDKTRVDGLASLLDSNNDLRNATTSRAGLMSAEDKVRLNGLGNLVNNSGVITTATTNTAGLMSTVDKARLDKLSNALLSSSSNGLKTATTSAVGLMSIEDKTRLDKLSSLISSNGSIAMASTSAAGLMSAADKALLNRLAILVSGEDG